MVHQPVHQQGPHGQSQTYYIFKNIHHLRLSTSPPAEQPLPAARAARPLPATRVVYPIARVPRRDKLSSAGAFWPAAPQTSASRANDTTRRVIWPKDEAIAPNARLLTNQVGSTRTPRLNRTQTTPVQVDLAMKFAEGQKSWFAYMATSNQQFNSMRPLC